MKEKSKGIGTVERDDLTNERACLFSANSGHSALSPWDSADFRTRVLTASQYCFSPVPVRHCAQLDIPATGRKSRADHAPIACHETVTVRSPGCNKHRLAVSPAWGLNAHKTDNATMFSRNENALRRSPRVRRGCGAGRCASDGEARNRLRFGPRMSAVQDVHRYFSRG